MELFFFVTEFFSEWSNLIPVVVLATVASLVIVLLARRRRLGAPWWSSLLVTAISGLAVYASFLVSMLGLDYAWSGLMAESALWLGIFLSIGLAWPIVWVVASLLNRRQIRNYSHDTSAFE